LVMFFALRPSASATKTSEFISPTIRRKAMRRPSGDIGGRVLTPPEINVLVLGRRTQVVVGAVEDGLAVGRDRGMDGAVRSWRDGLGAAAVGGDQMDDLAVALHQHEGDMAAVGRPGRVFMVSRVKADLLFGIICQRAQGCWRPEITRISTARLPSGAGAKSMA
jgi:hypothetical protein